jgi:monovalent cation:proton antiporter-2 (CPA2) family protein
LTHDLVLVAVLLLGAAVLAVPLAKRLGLGSIIGYLAAGTVVGPSGLDLIPDAESMRHVAELGVVMLLFLIGLELKPNRLWVMRRAVFALGGAQVAATAAVATLAGWLAGLAPGTAAVVGCGLALSSTALVLPMLAERDLLASPAGRDGFGVLLFQDLAIIPMVALLPLLGAEVAGGGPPTPVWQALLQAALCVGAILVGGRWLVRPLFRLVALAGAREIFFATALLIVFGTAALADAAGLSMSLGAFLGGVLLADSEYRHELQADLEPFEGLLLGLFFLSIGMAMNLGLLAQRPLLVLALVAAVMLLKAGLVAGLARLFGHDLGSALRMGASLAQVGEFALVLFGFAAAGGLLRPPETELLTLVTVLSMLATPLLFALEERLSAARLRRGAEEKPYDEMRDEGAPVILAGVGRMGQVVARILRVRGIPFTALEMNQDQLDVLRRYGTKVYYGDPSRPDLLRSAGAASARVLVVAIDDVELSLKVVDAARRHFPDLRVVARARNRRHAHHLMDRNVQAIVRETFHSSLVLAAKVLGSLGLEEAEVARTIDTFAAHDERLLERQHAIYRDETQLIQNARQAAEELRGLFQDDRPEAGVEAADGFGDLRPSSGRA